VRAHRLGAIRTSASTYQYVLLPDERPSKKRGVSFLDRAQAEAWLSGGVPSVPSQPESGPVYFERRIGIAIDPATGTVRSGMFYQRMAYSLQPQWALVVPVLEAGPAANALQRVAGISELGGDRHGVRLARIQDFEWPKTKASGREAVLWFLSPVRASDVSAGALASQGLEVLAVAAERPVRLGGWRMWRGQSGVGGPRGMRRYHPAGTCVYVRATVEPDWSRFHGQSLAQDQEERAAGFGVCLVGAWPRP